ncbi:MAG: peptide chain release factor N(5)-glutamine methyltransferase [Chloroflexota bacterium]|nr:peptide chain release factor N(5)-glutamine methyltransferase [Chloroflexota bacterium]
MSATSRFAPSALDWPTHQPGYDTNRALFWESHNTGKDQHALVSMNASRSDTDPPLTLAALMRSATSRLANAGIVTPRLDAEILLRHTLGINRTRLFLRLPESVGDDNASTFAALIDRRIAGEPIAYITGAREFMGLPMVVTPDVLIPRPETELLVEWALSTIRAGERVKVVDIGTGSGAIAISIAAHAPRSADVTVIGTDVSLAALSVAERNLARILPPHPVTFRQGSLGEPIHEPVDLVLANLPYLTTGQIAANPDLDIEPRIALDGGSRGLDLVDKLVWDLPRILSPRGAAGFELDPAQCQPVRSALKAAFPNHDVRIITDLAGRERHVVMRSR